MKDIFLVKTGTVIRTGSFGPFKLTFQLKSVNSICETLYFELTEFNFNHL